MLNIHDWFEKDIWITSGSFWNVMASEDVHRGLISRDHIKWEGIGWGTFSPERAKPLTHFLERSHHEMAHYLQCDDKDVLDPFYGSEVFTFRKDDAAWFNDDEFLKEIEVFVIQAILLGNEVTSNARELISYMNVRGFSKGLAKIDLFGRSQWETEPRENIEFCLSVARDCAKKWQGIGYDKLHKELVRKNALVREQLPELYRLQGRNPVRNEETELKEMLETIDKLREACDRAVARHPARFNPLERFEPMEKFKSFPRFNPLATSRR